MHRLKSFWVFISNDQFALESPDISILETRGIIEELFLGISHDIIRQILMNGSLDFNVFAATKKY